MIDDNNERRNQHQYPPCDDEDAAVRFRCHLRTKKVAVKLQVRLFIGHYLAQNGFQFAFRKAASQQLVVADTDYFGRLRRACPMTLPPPDSPS